MPTLYCDIRTGSPPFANAKHVENLWHYPVSGVPILAYLGILLGLKGFNVEMDLYYTLRPRDRYKETHMIISGCHVISSWSSEFIFIEYLISLTSFLGPYKYCYFSDTETCNYHNVY